MRPSTRGRGEQNRRYMPGGESRDPESGTEWRTGVIVTRQTLQRKRGAFRLRYMARPALAYSRSALAPTENGAAAMLANSARIIQA
jgi:hypothetical protein